MGLATSPSGARRWFTRATPLGGALVLAASASSTAAFAEEPPAPTPAQDCAKTTTAVDVITHAESSAEAYKNADLVGFVTHTTQLEAAIACLAEPLERNVAASVHRMLGLRAFVDQKTQKSQQAFGAARGIEPAYRFPETMVPPEHPIMEAYAAMPDGELGATKLIETAEGGYFHFDGRPTIERPANVPTIAQLFDGDGGVQRSAYLWPSDGMFEYTIGKPAGAPGEVDLRKWGPNLPLAASAGGAAILSGVAYAVAAGASAKYNAPDTPYEDGARLVTRNHTFTVVSGGAGAVALGLGVGAVVAGRW